MKHILLAVVGLSPQIVTETLYALHQQQKRVDEIHVITTREGKEKILALLLAEGAGALYSYLHEYGYEESDICLPVSNIHVITNERGEEIVDIVSEEDNEYLLRLCLELTFSLTKDLDTVVYFSVAGGRKTMSSCLTVAVQLYARAQDRLYHTLVSAEFENSREFFYPPINRKHIELVDNQGEPFYKDATLAKVYLVPIPFFPLRTMLPSEMLNSVMDPPSLIASLVREERACLGVDLKEGKLSYRGLECDLPPTQLAIYAFFAKKKRQCSNLHQVQNVCNDCYLSWTEIATQTQLIADIYLSLNKSQNYGEMSDSGILNLTQENFNSYKTKIHKNLLKAFGHYALRDLDICNAGRKPDTRYGIGIDKALISFIE